METTHMTLLQQIAEQESERDAQKRGTPDDIPDNPAARELERQRLIATGKPIPAWLQR